MLKIFGGGKPDHPMADLKEARKILDEIPVNDAHKALEVNAKGDSLSFIANFSKLHRFSFCNFKYWIKRKISIYFSFLFIRIFNIGFICLFLLLDIFIQINQSQFARFRAKK